MPLDRQTLKAQRQPAFVEPRKARLTENYFDDEAWLYERKLDGVRLIAGKKFYKVNLLRGQAPLCRSLGTGKEDGITWVNPRLMAEIGFTEWTEDCKLRHPRFPGLRDDKEPRDAVREAP